MRDQSNSQVLALLGDRLRAHRKVRRLSQTELAERAGVSRTTVSKLERGHDVTLESWVAVLRTLGLLGALDAAITAPPASPIDAFERAQTRQGDKTTWAWGDGR